MDLVTRLRALADEHKHPLVGWEQRLVATIREAADALEAEETRRMMLNTSNGEWSKIFHALEQERDALKAKLAREERTSQRLTRMLQAVVERNKKLEAVVAAVRVMMDGSRPPGEELAKSDMLAVAKALAALDAPSG